MQAHRTRKELAKIERVAADEASKQQVRQQRLPSRCHVEWAHIPACRGPSGKAALPLQQPYMLAHMQQAQRAEC